MGCLLLVVPFAESELGVTSSTSAMIVMAMGVAELLFRIPFGWAGDHPKVNRTYLLGFTFIMLGVIFLAFPMCSNYMSIMIFASLSGIFQVKINWRPAYLKPFSGWFWRAIICCIRWYFNSIEQKSCLDVWFGIVNSIQWYSWSGCTNLFWPNENCFWW